ncbi:Calbindin-32 [Eumeta japonica]|uniref:Calbindin-32 n=1 Tax=Eumeta variegata TaxID=151549 RepID=A0A4C1VCV9_EUMVA|nr:Calbindin-32 [Eumeta japonica]
MPPAQRVGSLPTAPILDITSWTSTILQIAPRERELLVQAGVQDLALGLDPDSGAALNSDCNPLLVSIPKQMREVSPVHLPAHSRLQVAAAVIKGATKLTKDDIERVFSLYDRDNNGSIENEELRGFLKDLLELVKKSLLQSPLYLDQTALQDYDAQDLLEFEETILQGVEYSSDGKISRKQLTMILLALARHHQEEETTT